MGNKIIKIKIENTEDLEEALKLISKGSKTYVREKLEEEEDILAKLGEVVETLPNMFGEIMNGEETAEELKAILESFKAQEKVYKKY